MKPRESSLEKSMRPGKNSNYVILPPLMEWWCMVDAMPPSLVLQRYQGKANLILLRFL